MVERETIPNPERMPGIKDYSPALYKRLLSGDLEGKETNHTVGSEVASNVKELFYHGSMDDRAEHWKNKGLYGQQMKVWVKNTTAWVEGLKENPQNEVLLDVLKGVKLGSDGMNHDELKNDPGVSQLVSKINEKLPEDARLDLQTMDDTALEILKMYDTYLTPRETPEMQESVTSKLIGDLMGSIVFDRQLPGNGKRSPEEIEKRFGAIAPFLRVVGLDAQHGLSAMIAAEIHAQTDQDTLKDAKVEEVGQTDDSALKFFNTKAKEALKNAKEREADTSEANHEPEDDEGEDIEPLEMGKPYPLPEIFGMVEEPKATERDNPKWWVGDKFPDNIVDQLRPEFGNLELRKPLFLIQADDRWRLNPEVFQPAHDLEGTKDKPTRFDLLEHLTDNDSGVLALAGVSAENPEQQAELYGALGKVVLAVHNANPDLVKEFIEAQNAKGDPNARVTSLDYFAYYERERQLMDKATVQKYSDAFQQRQMELLQQEKPKSRDEFIKIVENDQAIQKYNEEIDQLKQKYLLESLKDTPDKLFAFSMEDDRESGPGKIVKEPQINIEKTVSQWKERLATGELQKALNSGEMTPEQIRQIEFLSHAVDIPKVIQWLQKGNAASTSPDNGNPPKAPGAGVTVQETVPPTPADTVEAAQEDGDRGKPKGPYDKPDAPGAGVALQPHESLESTIPASIDGGIPKPDDKLGGPDHPGTSETQAEGHKKEKQEHHGKETLGKLVIKGLPLAISIGEAINAHHESKKAKEATEAQELLEDELAAADLFRIKGNIVELHHMTDETYEAAQKKAKAAKELLEKYQDVRATPSSYEEIKRLDDDLKYEGMKERDQSEILRLSSMKLELITLHHESPDEKHEFDEEVVIFINEADNSLFTDSGTDRPLFINKYAFLRKRAFGSTATLLDRTATYDTPKFDDNGELSGVYYLQLTEEQANFLNELRPSTQHPESPTQSNDLSGQIDTSGRSRRGIGNTGQRNSVTA